MIILDTSIWVEYFKGNPNFKAVIDNLLRAEKILAFDFVFGELMQGAKGHEKEKIIGFWEILPKVNIREIGFYAGKYSQENKSRDKGVGLIDCSIIYATIVLESKLWTLDKKILKILDDRFLYKPH
jgi:predicted nucleic acid-binding protein